MDGCTSPLFARGWCRFHYGTEYLAPKQYEKPPKNYTIARRTKKRASQERKYHTNRKTFIEQEKEAHPKGQIYCIFCDNEITGEPDLHHADGRDDEKILNEAFWFLAHNYCHVHEYHSKSCQDIWWWDNYIFRIRNINPEIYEKEQIREEKSRNNQ